MEMHADLEPVRFLIGSWQGNGRGEYPTIEPFGYREEVSFVPGPGKPFLFYTQRTRGEDGAPLHSEAGYVRMTPGGPELVIAQPTGLVEVHGGELVDRTIEFRSTVIGATETAKPSGKWCAAWWEKAMPCPTRWTWHTPRFRSLSISPPRCNGSRRPGPPPGVARRAPAVDRGGTASPDSPGRQAPTLLAQSPIGRGR